jgi:hypothetical protein
MVRSVARVFCCGDYVMTTRIAAVVLGLGAQIGAVVGCGSRDDAPEACVAALREPIFHGDSTESYLGLSREERNAFVSVQFDSTADEMGLPCSGVLVASRFVLTAGHCKPKGDGGKVTLRFGENRETPELTAVTSGWDSPPDASMDALLIRLDDAVPATIAEPLPLSALGPVRLIGARVLLGGYGITHDDKVGLRRFVTEPVTEATDVLLTVDGAGKSGACIADSGGPAVWREAAPAVVGILTNGDPDCLGRDRYVSAAALRDWVSATTGAAAQPIAMCGGISAEGGCFVSDSLAQAVWCEAGQLRSSECVMGRVCGWDQAAAGYRCVPSDADTCRGVSQLGGCRGDSLLSCEAGVLRELHCTVCERCEVEPASGRAHCRPNTG